MACSVAPAADTYWSITSTDYTTTDYTVSSGNRLVIANGSDTSAGSGNAETTFTTGAITVENGGTLFIHGWTHSDRDIDTAGKLTIASDIEIQGGGTLRLEDGSYYMSGNVNVTGTQENVSTITSSYDKGFLFNNLTGESDAVLKLKNGTWSPTVFALQGSGAYAGRINLNHDGDTKVYLAINSTAALANTASVALEKSHSYLAINVSEVTLSSVAGTTGAEIILAKDAINRIIGSATPIDAAKVNISNDGSSSDIFSGTIGSGITLNIAAGSQEFGQITNNGTITVGDNGKFVVTNIQNHAGYIADSTFTNHDGTTDSLNGFASGTVHLYTEGSSGTGPDTVYYKDTAYSVSNGQIRILDYEAYTIGDNATQTDIEAAKVAATNNNKTLKIVSINHGGTLVADKVDDDKAFFDGEVYVNAGGVLQLSKDALGWSASSSPIISLAGAEGASNVATMQLNDSVTTGSNSAQKPLVINMNGYANISAADDKFIDTFCVQINTTGGNNEISADIRDRGGIMYNTAKDSTLLVSGKVLASPGGSYAGTPGTTKTGSGTVTFTAADSTFTGKVVVDGGEFKLQGDGTTLHGGAEIKSGKLIGDAGTVTNGDTTRNGVVTIKESVTGSGFITAQSGTLIFERNVDITGNAQLGKNAAESTKLVFAGATNKINTLDASNSGQGVGTVVFKKQTNTVLNGSGGAGALWMNAGTKVLLEEKAQVILEKYGYTYTGSGVDDGVSSVGTIYAGADAHQTPDNANLILTNIKLTVNNTGEKDIMATLINSGVTNAGSGLVKITNAANTLSEVNATGGDILVKNSSASEVSIGSVSTSEGNTVTAEIGALKVNTVSLGAGLSSENYALTTTGTLTLGSLELNLTDYTTGEYKLISTAGLTWTEGNYTTTGLADGLTAQVGFAEGSSSNLVLTIGTASSPEPQPSSWSLSGEVAYDPTLNMLTLNLEQDLTSYDFTEDGAIIIPGISDSIMKTILGLTGLPEDGMVGIQLMGADDVAFAATADQMIGFQGKDGVYWGTNVGSNWQYYVQYIPEPATATLSLLALAGLAARRRRR